MEQKELEISLGAFDSELGGWEYTIPEGYKAEIKNGKVIVRKPKSEDEKIRKAIGYAIGQSTHTDGTLINGVSSEEALAWLEKQDEKKLDEWIEADNVHLSRCIEYSKFDMTLCKNDIEWLESLKSRVLPKPKREWSEEDETNISRAIDIIKDAKEGLLSYKTDDGIYECEQAIKVLDKLLKNGYSVLWKETDYDNIEKLIKILPQCIFRHPHILERDECLKLVSWLKSLRPLNRWKPSDEQMKGIECAIKTLRHQLNVGDKRLDSLYNDLKKLREK